jgi:hypothetical protein
MRALAPTPHHHHRQKCPVSGTANFICTASSLAPPSVLSVARTTARKQWFLCHFPCQTIKPMFLVDCVAESFRRRLCLQVVRAELRSQPLAKSRPNLSPRQCYKLNNNHLKVRTLPIVPIYRIDWYSLRSTSPLLAPHLDMFQFRTLFCS